MSSSEPAKTIEHRTRIGEEKRSRTRQRLLAAAARVLADRGGDAGIDAFITAAGVARATFYNHFRTRDDITAALWREIGHGSMVGIAAAYAGVSDPAERIVIGIRTTLARCAADPAWGWLFVHVASNDGEASADLRRFLAVDLAPLAESGAFPSTEIEMAAYFMLGSGARIARAILTGAATTIVPGYCRMILRGLGVEPDRVEAVLATPGANEPIR